MSKNRVILRSFSYLNSQIVEDYISSILGGVPQEQTETQTLYTQTKGSIKILQSETGEESKKHETFTIPTTSLFSSLYTDLNNMKMIKFPEKFAPNILTFERGDLMEVEGVIRPVGASHVFKTISKLLKTPIGQVAVSRRQYSPDQKTTIDILRNFPLENNQKEKVLMKFYPLEEPNFVCILQIDQQFLRKGIEIEDLYGDEFKALLRVNRILSNTEEFDIFQFYGFKLRNLPKGEEIIQKIIDASKNQDLAAYTGVEVSKEDFYITAPALIAEPIAIYI